MEGAGVYQEAQVGKATGNSSHSSSNQIQPRQRSERPKASIGLTFSDTDSDDEAELSQQQTRPRKSNAADPSSQRQQGRHDAARHFTGKRAANAEHANDFIDSNNDWDAIEEIKPSPTSTTDISTSPSYDFPGTWTAAYHDTTTALTQVGIASKTYASALTQSGIGIAGWSIGNAFLSTTRRGASKFTGWAVDEAGVVPGDLPRPMRGWLERNGRRYGALTSRGSQMHEPGADQPGPFFLEDENEGFMVEGYQLGPSQLVRTQSGDMDAQRLRELRGWRRTATSYSPPLPRMVAQLEDALLERTGRVEHDDDAAQEDEGSDDGLKGLFDIEDDD